MRSIGVSVRAGQSVYRCIGVSVRAGQSVHRPTGACAAIGVSTDAERKSKNKNERRKNIQSQDVSALENGQSPRRKSVGSSARRCSMQCS